MLPLYYVDIEKAILFEKKLDAQFFPLSCHITLAHAQLPLFAMVCIEWGNHRVKVNVAVETNKQTKNQPQLALGRPFRFLFFLGLIVPSQLPHQLGSCPAPTSSHGLGLHLLCT